MAGGTLELELGAGATHRDLAKPIICKNRIASQLMSISYHASPCRADVG